MSSRYSHRSPPRPSVSSEPAKWARQNDSPAMVNRNHTAASSSTVRPPTPSPMQPPMQLPVQLPIQAPILPSNRPPNQAPIHPPPRFDLPATRSRFIITPQALRQSRAGGRDAHASSHRAAREAGRNPPNPSPERDPRKALLRLQYADTSSELKKAEGKFCALVASKQGSDPQRVADQFTDVLATITRCRHTAQEIEDELAGRAGPSMPAVRVADRSAASRNTAGLGGHGGAGASTGSHGGARLW
ncbi:hypothetical protein EPUS_04820 [Endocarpon pusillum Z07020]|uniref:Uncharacterized protein n=1 Tax=Endocarpon pusillum (strain Z07020 / HMAS-L-300199) TaxID=1263415 RepID=U1GRM7_ENDPU|nr:uncharacterized protein EPUS_04820 [Endocarpon pusillum Z07020]ERF75038.1 hypothetical protein EPUS_04820 [Endocarpon pusillum Z07020]